MRMKNKKKRNKTYDLLFSSLNHLHEYNLIYLVMVSLVYFQTISLCIYHWAFFITNSRICNFCEYCLDIVDLL